MKKLIRTLILNIIALKATAAVVPCLSFSNGFKTVILTALALTVFEYFLKPIAKLLFLPINLLTLGTLRWVINVIGLYLVTLWVKGFSVLPYYFPGINWQGFSIPAAKVSLLLTYVLVSLIINLIVTVLRWLISK